MAEPKREPQTLDEMLAEAEAVEEAAAAETEAATKAAPEAVQDPLQSELEALRAERDDLKDRFMRALAEAENARKRAERDRREAEIYGGSRLARDLLPVYDALRRALDAVTEEHRATMAAFIEGIDLTQRELTNVFARHGVKVIAPQPGDRFDPAVHQAMFEAPVPGTKAGEIIQVAAEGFMLHDRLLRPAQVGVSSTPAD
jgi:molecular chaperone GrpE